MLKPMLAAKADLVKLKFPVYVSPKLDGVRAIVKDGVVLSRSMKPIPNQHVQKLFGQPSLHGVDGELIVGDMFAPDVYRKTVSAVMRKKERPANLQFILFDIWSMPFTAYEERMCFIRTPHKTVKWLPFTRVETLTDLLEKEKQALKFGAEGLIIRGIRSFYKYGRSTVREASLLKLKRFHDSEAVIIGVEELMHNSNLAFTNELGQTARSHAKSGMVGMGKLGALIVKDIITDVEFKLGTGFTDDERVAFWHEPIIKLNTTLVKYKHFPSGGKDKPRHPVFLGLRDKKDMG